MTKRNQRKRQREEIREKETEKKSPTKILKTKELPVKNESTKPDTSSAAQQAEQEDEMIVTKEETTADHVEEPKIKDEIDDEDPEEYEEMDDASPQTNSSNEVRVSSFLNREAEMTFVKTLFSLIGFWMHPFNFYAVDFVTGLNFNHAVLYH